MGPFLVSFFLLTISSKIIQPTKQQKHQYVTLEIATIIAIMLSLNRNCCNVSANTTDQLKQELPQREDEVQLSTLHKRHMCTNRACRQLLQCQREHPMPKIPMLSQNGDKPHSQY